MKFSEAWLREWVDPPISTAQLVEQLTMAGLEVDSVTPAAPDFAGIVVGQVLTLESHPNAARLQICTVDVAQSEPLSIVCGASNVRQGMRVPVALEGAQLPGDINIQRTSVRGVESYGMLCSAKELGLAEAADGLFELSGDAILGEDLRQSLRLDDACLELDLTPNRGDCLGISGIAREVGVMNRCPVSGPHITEVNPVITDRFPVAIEAPGDCPRYLGRIIKGGNLTTQTPLWMQERLRRSGLRSLGPVIDVTNYVLLELGQPLHAFDLDQLTGGIRVRRALQGETLTLLNGQKIDLDPAMLVIADHAKVVALAGIMGGLDSAVSDVTETLFLESAFFAPMAILGRARKYGLHTDASHRFERGVDPTLQQRALERATELLVAIVGGEPGPVIQCLHADHLPTRAAVRLRSARIHRVLGIDVPAAEAAEVLQHLGMQVEKNTDGWEVVPPSYRFDIGIEVDLIEEIGRIYGYSRLPNTRSHTAVAVSCAPEADFDLERAKSVLVQRGYQEAITYSFVDPDLQRRLDPHHNPLPLANPISADLSVMRTSLWPGLVGAVLYNQRRQQNRVRLFEVGLRFIAGNQGLHQEKTIAGIINGNAYPEQWAEQGRAIDFFDVKGHLRALLALTGWSEAFQFIAAKHPALHPGQSAGIQRDGIEIGWLGMLHPLHERQLGITGKTFLFELSLEALQQGRIPHFTSLSRFPANRRDIAIVVDEGVSYQAVYECIAQAASATLQEIRLFDVYRGENLGYGRKSLALGLILQALSRTLKDQEVDAIIRLVLERLNQEFGATLRE